MFHVPCFKFHSVLLLSIFYFLLSFSAVHAAQVYLLPQTQNIHVGDTLISELRLNTEGEQINAFDISVLYPKDVLEVENVIQGGSLANLWIQDPARIDSKGALLLQGGTTEGFSGEGFIVKIIFKALKTGTATISFARESKILLHDGRGTPTLGIFSPAQYSVGKKSVPAIAILSSTHPDENTWQKGDVISLAWEPEEGVVYSYVLSRDIIQNSDDIPETLVGTLDYDNPTDGIYYFSIIKSKENDTWSTPVRRKILHDRTPPKPFEVFVGRDESLFEGRSFASFNAKDDASGVSRYEIKEYSPWTLGFGGPEWKTAESPYPLGDQKLRSILKVKAIDAAGNERVATFMPLSIQVAQNALFILLLSILIVTIMMFYKRI